MTAHATAAHGSSLDDLPELLDVKQYAALYRIGTKQAYEAVHRGEVPGVIRIGKSIRISKRAVVAQLEAGMDVGSRA